VDDELREWELEEDDEEDDDDEDYEEEGILGCEPRKPRIES